MRGARHGQDLHRGPRRRRGRRDCELVLVELPNVRRAVEALLSLLLTLWCACLVNSHENSQWDLLLSEPSKQTFGAAAHTVAASAQPCNPATAPTQAQRTQLFQLIQRGNQWAFQGALLVADCWDGGEAEDFNRSAGMFFELQARQFLQTVVARGTGDAALKNMLTMLPLDTADDVDRMISVVAKRIELLRGVRGKSLEKVRAKGLEYLEEERQQLEKTKAELRIGQ